MGISVEAPRIRRLLEQWVEENKDYPSLQLLGEVNISKGGSVLRFRGQPEMALLIYLAHTGQTHSRETLANLFWEERTTRQSLANLRTVLARLRSLVGDVLVVTSKTLAYEPAARHFVDSVRLNERLVALKGFGSGVDAATLDDALRLYKGDFLPGFFLPTSQRFNDWVSVVHERLRQQVLAGYEQLFAAFLLLPVDKGDLALARDAAQRWVGLDPLNEIAHEQLLRVLVISGHSAAALAHFDRLVALLAAEMGVEPGPALLRLAAAIRSGAFGSQRLSNARATGKALIPENETAVSLDILVPPVAVDTTGYAWDQARLLPLTQHVVFRLPLVGREHEFQQMVHSYRLAVQGQVQVIFLEGESGAGKSRLANEFLSWAGEQGADVMRGRAFKSGGRLPYHPLVDALRERLERENAPEDLLDDVWLSELTRFLPELRARYPDLSPAVGDEATSRINLFETVARLGLALAQRAPLLWLVDDVQWADTGTIELLQYLARRWVKEQAEIMFLVLVRLEDSTDNAGQPLLCSRQRL